MSAVQLDARAPVPLVPLQRPPLRLRVTATSAEAPPATDGASTLNATNTNTNTNTNTSSSSSGQLQFTQGEFVRFRFEARLDPSSSSAEATLRRCRFSALARRKNAPPPQRRPTGTAATASAAAADSAASNWVTVEDEGSRIDDGGARAGPAWWIGDSTDVPPAGVAGGGDEDGGGSCRAWCEVTGTFPSPGTFCVGFACSQQASDDQGASAAVAVATSEPLVVVVV